MPLERTDLLPAQNLMESLNGASSSNLEEPVNSPAPDAVAPEASEGRPSLCPTVEDNGSLSEAASFLILTYCIAGVTGPDAEQFKGEIAQIIAPYLGRVLTRADLIGIRDLITQFYLQGGYITTRADHLKVLDNGTLIVPIVEGFIWGGVQVAIDQPGSSSPSEEASDNTASKQPHSPPQSSIQLERYVRSQINPVIPQRGDGPVNLTTVENQVRLLTLDPLFESVYSVLSVPDDEAAPAGASTLTIYVRETQRLAFDIAFNNYSPPSLGAEGFDWQVSFSSRFLSYGERFYAGGRYNPFAQLSSSKTTVITNSSGEQTRLGGPDDSTAWVIGYTTPLGRAANGGLGALNLQINWERKDVLQGAASNFDFRSEVENYSIDYRYPIGRSLAEEWTLSAGFTLQEGQTFINKTRPFPIGFGPNNLGLSRTSVFSLALEYLRRGSNNILLSRAQINVGTGLFNATRNPPPLPDGQFISGFFQTQMLQKLADNHTLVVRGLAQLTPDSLLPIDQFVIGGARSVRGYRENVRSGDNGIVFSVEDRIDVFIDGIRRLQVSPFFDTGVVWNSSANPNQLPTDNFLASLGAGLVYYPFSTAETAITGNPSDVFEVRVDYGIPLIRLQGTGDTLQDQGWHFGIRYSFGFF